jgi:hypothetical protein
LFARRKLDETTFVVPIDKKNTYEGINYGDNAFMGFRAYIDPTTKVGPSASEVILDRVIILKPK